MSQSVSGLSQEDQEFLRALTPVRDDVNRVLEEFNRIYAAENEAVERMNRAMSAAEKLGATTTKNEMVAERRRLSTGDAGQQIANLCAIKDFGDSKAPVKLEACTKIINQCIEGNNQCLAEFTNIANQLEKNGLDDSTFSPQLLSGLLNKMGLKKIEQDPNKLGYNPKVDQNAIDLWLTNLRKSAGTNTDELKRINVIANNHALIKMLKHFYVKGYFPDKIFGTVEYDVAFSKLSKFKLLPRYTKHPTLNPAVDLSIRGTRRPINLIRAGATVKAFDSIQVGGGKINDRHARFFDAIEKQFMMSGGGSSYPLVNPAFEKLLADLMKDLESVGKTVESGDLNKIRDIMSQYQKSERKVQNIIMLITKLRELVDNRMVSSEGQRRALLETIRSALLEEEIRLNVWKDQGRTVLNIFKHIRDESPINNADLWKTTRKAKQDAQIEDIKALFNYEENVSGNAYLSEGQRQFGNTTSAWSEGEKYGASSPTSSQVSESAISRFQDLFRGRQARKAAREARFVREARAARAGSGSSSATSSVAPGLGGLSSPTSSAAGGGAAAAAAAPPPPAPGTSKYFSWLF